MAIYNTITNNQNLSDISHPEKSFIRTKNAMKSETYMLHRRFFQLSLGTQIH